MTSGCASSRASDSLVKKPMPRPARTPVRIVSMLFDDRFPRTVTLKGPFGPTKGQFPDSRRPL